jgi:uncharacterized Zn finger protein (UPF0148 family)
MIPQRARPCENRLILSPWNHREEVLAVFQPKQQPPPVRSPLKLKARPKKCPACQKPGWRKTRKGSYYCPACHFSMNYQSTRKSTFQSTGASAKVSGPHADKRVSEVLNAAPISCNREITKDRTAEMVQPGCLDQGQVAGLSYCQTSTGETSHESWGNPRTQQVQRYIVTASDDQQHQPVAATSADFRDD